MLDVVLETLRAELSDLDDAARITRLTVRLLLAMVLGGLIGYERELRDSAAGLRTHMLVAVGCAVFVLVPQQAGLGPEEMSRVLQGLLAGVGFLGAGAVLKSSGEGHIRGLTTAASLWATAAVGVTAGLGQEATAIFVTLLVLFILAVVLRVELRMTRRRRRAGARAGARADDPPASPRARGGGRGEGHAPASAPRDEQRLQDD